MMTDPIADMLTRIRNAVASGKQELTVPYSYIKFAIAQILAREGFIHGVVRQQPKGASFQELKFTLQYGPKKDSPIHEVTRISKPGRRVYAGYEDLPRVANGLGIAIVSTPQGLMTNKEARKKKLGGEVICQVY